MQRSCLVAIVFSIAVLIVGLACESKASAAEQTEILKVTVGQPTALSDLRYQNTASLSISRTGTIAAFYPKPRTGPKFYRVSKDGGLTWGPEKDSPSQLCGGSASATLRDGGMLKFLTTGSVFKGEAEFHRDPMQGEYKDGWFMLHSTFAWFNDDFTKYEVAPVKVYMPDAVTTKQTHLAMSCWPIFADDKMIQLPNGDLLASMQGVFKGDTKGRVILCRSSDQGHSWRYYSTVSYEPKDPNPELPGHYLGSAEPSFALLPNGQMLCAMRRQYAHYPGEYKPLSVCWSNDMGKTWTRPISTKPYLMNICPELAVLDNGVVVCEYGRPGFHVVFSLDNGHTWQDRISFSDLPEPIITGQFDMIKVGPNKLVAIGSDATGVKVWPIAVQRVKVSQTHVGLEGRVLDEQGNPIAGAMVERGPNRYALDSWLEGTKLDVWKVAPVGIGSPKLSYLSIRKENGYPIVETDSQGRFRFDSVKLGEYVLTVEDEGYAPQHRHIKLAPEATPQEFQLKAGRKICNRVMDDRGQPVAGACVVLNRWHVHTDCAGFFHWSLESPLPEQVAIRIYKRYIRGYETLRGTVSLSQIERQPIILRHKGHVDRTQHFEVDTPSPGKPTVMRIGDFGGGQDRSARSSVDEVYIYNRALTLEEAEWANIHARDRKRGMDIPVNIAQPTIKGVPDPENKTLVAKRGGVLFYAGFDGSRNADANASGTARLVAGGGKLTADGFDSVRGGALETGDGVGYVEFSAEGNILPDEGTIEMWIKPEDWNAYDKQEHVFFQADGQGRVRFYKRADVVNCFMVRGPSVKDPSHFDDKYQGMVQTAYTCQQMKGRWTQYFLIWKKGELIAYYRGGVDTIAP